MMWSIHADSIGEVPLLSSNINDDEDDLNSSTLLRPIMYCAYFYLYKTLIDVSEGYYYR